MSGSFVFIILTIHYKVTLHYLLFYSRSNLLQAFTKSYVMKKNMCGDGANSEFECNFQEKKVHLKDPNLYYKEQNVNMH